MRWHRYLTVAAVVSLALTGRAAATESGLTLRKDACAGAVNAPVLGTTVELRITGIVARARVTQIFKNPTQDLMEGIYVFPLPDGAAVDTLRMNVGGRVIAGVVQERQEARQTYEAAKEQGTKATLIEQQTGGVFRTSIANIGPGDTIEVELEMQQVVQFTPGRFSLRFPMVVAPRYEPQGAATLQPPLRAAGAPPVNPFAFHADLVPGFPLARVESSTHRIAVAKGKGKDGGERWAIDLADGMAFADGDVDLTWAPAVGREPRAVYFSEQVDGERYSLLMLMPPDDEQAASARLPRETIFVIDTSGSMAGTSIEQARQALLLGISRLQSGDRFNVIQFNSTAEALFPSSVPADSDHLARASQYVNALQPAGGTEMLKALDVALRGAPAQGGLVSQVIFATDGQVGNEAPILAAIRRNLGERRLFTVAIGSAPNSAFLRKAAEIGRGTFTAIDRVDRVAAGMGHLLAQLEAPMLRQIDVRWDDPAAEAWPARAPDLYLGEPLVVSARTAAAGSVAVSGLRDGRSWSDEIPVPAEVRGAGLDKLWAQRKIESLLDSLVEHADPDTVRRAVVELGLRHHLLTPFTSLVAIDVEPTAPPGLRPVTRVVPVNPPRDVAALASADAAAMISTGELLTVMAEAPLLDEHRISTGVTVSQAELARIPAARDPWMVLRATPGVLTDRVNAGGNESGQQSAYRLAGAPAGQNVFEMDGAVITDLASLGPPPAALDFDSFEEIDVATGGADVQQPAAGARVQLTAPRGTNEIRGSAEARWSGAALNAEGSPQGNRLASLRSGTAEAGGPLRSDHVWLWGSLGRSDVDRIAFGGQPTALSRTNGKLKLNAQLAGNNAAFVLGGWGGTSGSGLGAGPQRSAGTTWRREGQESLWRLEDTHIPSASFYLTAAAVEVDGRAEDDPLRPSGEARIDAAGVAHGSWFGRRDDRRTRTFSLLGDAFFNLGQVANELRTGVEDSRLRRTARLTPPSLLTVAGEGLGLPAGLDVREDWRSGTADARTGVTSLWTQDQISFRNLNASVGLRIDQQDLGIPGASTPRTLVPRLGLNWSLGPERRTIVRASLSRYASRLGDRGALLVAAGSPGILFSFLPAGGPPAAWYGSGADPLRPGVSPNAVAADLRPEITDEAIAGVERAIGSDARLGFQAAWRRTGDILEERLLVRDADGVVRPATAADWLPAGTLTGSLPSGASFAVPYFDLRPGRSPSGGRLLVNGDRRQDSLQMSLTWEKRLSHLWMTRGYLSWQDWTWHLGKTFRRFDDPTNTLGGGDDEGGRVAESAATSALQPHDPVRFLGGRWSFMANGLVQLPRSFNLALAVSGREGALLPYYRQVARDRAGLAQVELTGRVDSFRTRDLVTVDARLEKVMTAGGLDVTWSAEAFNLLGESAAVARELDLGLTRGGSADELTAPRTLRLGLRLAWR